MKIHSKTWLVGLLQALILVCLSFVINSGLFTIVRTNIYNKAVEPALLSTLTLVGFAATAMVYTLIVLGYPLYLLSIKKGLEGLKAVAYTAFFLVILFAIAYVGIQLFAQSREIKSWNPTVPSSLSHAEALKKSEEVRARANMARLEYQENQLKESTHSPKAYTKGLTIEPIEGKMYPYVIDINTGEKTPLEE